MQGTVDLAIDYEHELDLAEQRKAGPVVAAGWIKSLEARDDGIWGRVEWTETAQQMIKSREYRYLSPVVYADSKDKVVRLIIGASLVQRPNLNMKSLSSQEEPAMPGQPTGLAEIAAALSLEPDATLRDILDAIAESGKVDPEKYVPIEAVADLMKDRNKVTAGFMEIEAEARVNDAMRKGHLTPAMKPWAKELCCRSIESFEAFLKGSNAPYAHIFNPPKMPWDKEGFDPSSKGHAGNEQLICNQLGLSPGDLK